MRSVTLSAVIVMLFSVTSLVFAGALPEDVFKGRMLLSDKPFPVTAASTSAYVAQMKKMAKTSFTLDRRSRKLHLYFGAFFASPAQDNKLNLVIYDITGGQHTKKGSIDYFVEKKSDRRLISSVNLESPDIDANKKYLLTIERAGQVLASGEVAIRGEETKYKGKVEFGEEGNTK